jgi:mono/diheme cytochrome c family protein
MKHTTLLFFVLAVILFFALAQLMAKSIFPMSPLPMTSAASGEEMYSVYCSSCHGRDARGVSAPDLTTLSKRNNGKFPTLLVKETIRRETRVGAHGPKDMPAWGFAFRYVGSGSRLEIDVRINNLTEYIQTLQEK